MRTEIETKFLGSSHSAECFRWVFPCWFVWRWWWFDAFSLLLLFLSQISVGGQHFRAFIIIIECWLKQLWIAFLLADSCFFFPWRHFLLSVILNRSHARWEFNSKWWASIDWQTTTGIGTSTKRKRWVSCLGEVRPQALQLNNHLLPALELLGRDGKSQNKDVFLKINFFSLDLCPLSRWEVLPAARECSSVSFPWMLFLEWSWALLLDASRVCPAWKGSPWNSVLQGTDETALHSQAQRMKELITVEHETCQLRFASERENQRHKRGWSDAESNLWK